MLADAVISPISWREGEFIELSILVPAVLPSLHTHNFAKNLYSQEAVMGDVSTSNSTNLCRLPLSTSMQIGKGVNSSVTAMSSRKPTLIPEELAEIDICSGDQQWLIAEQESREI